MKKIILTYGLLSGVVAAVLMVGTAFYFNNSPDFKNGEAFGYTGILLSMLFVFFGVRAYRDQGNARALSLRDSFQVGLFISLISCACYVVAWMVVYPTLMPDFMDKFTAHSLAQMQQSGATEAQIQAATAEMQAFKIKYQNPLYRAGMTFLEPLPVALLATLLSALVLRRRPAPES